MWRPSPSLPLAGWLSHLPSHPGGVLLSGDVSRTVGTMEWTTLNMSQSTKNLHRLGNSETTERAARREQRKSPMTVTLEPHNPTAQLHLPKQPTVNKCGTHTQHFLETWATSVIRHPRNDKEDNQISWWINTLLRKARPCKNILIVSER